MGADEEFCFAVYFGFERIFEYNFRIIRCRINGCAYVNKLFIKFKLFIYAIYVNI